MGEPAASDADLVAGARAGDRDSFGELYRRHAPAVYDHLARVVRDQAAAEDLTQATFLAAFESLAQLRDPARARGWLFTIAHRKAMDHLVARRRVEPMPEQEPASAERDVADRAASADVADMVWAAAASLEPRQYTVLDLVLRRGLSTPEVAQVLHVNAGHAAVLVHRARAALRSAVRALLVARNRGRCAELKALVPGAVRRLDPLLRARVDQHLRGCPTCRRLALELTAPEALLSGLPLIALPDRLAREGFARLLVRTAVPHPPGSSPARPPGGRPAAGRPRPAHPSGWGRIAPHRLAGLRPAGFPLAPALTAGAIGAAAVAAVVVVVATHGGLGAAHGGEVVRPGRTHAGSHPAPGRRPPAASTAAAPVRTARPASAPTAAGTPRARPSPARVRTRPAAWVPITSCVQLSGRGAYRLVADAHAAGTCLTITAVGVTVDLAGHTITGSGSGVGTGIWIEPGAAGATLESTRPGAKVVGFGTGIWVDSGAGARLLGPGIAVEGNVGIGVFVDGATGGVVSGLRLAGNGRFGLYLQDAFRIDVTGNVVGRSGIYGIWVQSSSADRIERNRLDGSGVAGIFLGCSNAGQVDDGSCPGSLGNTVLANRVASGGDYGIAVATGDVGNTLSGDVAAGDRVDDLLDANPGCRTAGAINLWVDDTGSRSQRASATCIG